MTNTSALATSEKVRSPYSLSLWGVLASLLATLFAGVLCFVIPMELDLSRFSGPSAEEVSKMSREQLLDAERKSKAMDNSLREYLRSAEVNELNAKHFKRFYWPSLVLFNLLAFFLLWPVNRSQGLALFWPSLTLFILLQIH